MVLRFMCIRRLVPTTANASRSATLSVRGSDVPTQSDRPAQTKHKLKVSPRYNVQH